MQNWGLWILSLVGMASTVRRNGNNNTMRLLCIANVLANVINFIVAGAIQSQCTHKLDQIDIINLTRRLYITILCYIVAGKMDLLTAACHGRN